MHASEEPAHADYLALRNRLLGPLRDRFLTTDQLCEAGRIMCGRPESLSLYGIPAPEMDARGIRILGRTAVECTKDPHPVAVAGVITDIEATAPAADGEAMVVDLFCGSGNIGHHLGRCLDRPVYASELDPVVHEAGRRNLDRVGSTVRLRHADYRDLLGALPARSERDIYIVEPSWGQAFTPEGLDLTRTSPPVPEIIGHIQRSRDHVPCLVVVETSDRVVRGSLDTWCGNAVHLRTLVPKPFPPHRTGSRFHLYRLGGSRSPAVRVREDNGPDARQPRAQAAEAGDGEHRQERLPLG
ncbi:class I SAM-dependent methyltransferase [Streptomyces caelestis]|uniref:Class I SAM-dependent methyltransferase n=1 Tax=Streptomyces heliomycini TaxID=284032 RepID=A0ABV5L3S5_9ACTN